MKPQKVGPYFSEFHLESNMRFVFILSSILICVGCGPRCVDDDISLTTGDYVADFPVQVSGGPTNSIFQLAQGSITAKVDSVAKIIVFSAMVSGQTISEEWSYSVENLD